MNTLETFLNIYSESEENREFNIESIAQNCLNVELNFIPYHLTHTELVVWKDDEIVTKEVGVDCYKKAQSRNCLILDGFCTNRKRQSNTRLQRKCR